MAAVTDAEKVFAGVDGIVSGVKFSDEARADIRPIVADTIDRALFRHARMYRGPRYTHAMAGMSKGDDGANRGRAGRAHVEACRHAGRGVEQKRKYDRPHGGKRQHEPQSNRDRHQQDLRKLVSGVADRTPPDLFSSLLLAPASPHPVRLPLPRLGPAFSSHTRYDPIGAQVQCALALS